MKIKIIILTLLISSVNIYGQSPLKRLLLTQQPVDLKQDLLFLYEANDLFIGSVQDESINNNDGSSENSSGNLSVGVTGKLGLAFQRTGQDDGWSSPSFSSLTLSEYTLSLWVKGGGTIQLIDVWFLNTFSNAGEGIRANLDISDRIHLDVVVWNGTDYDIVNTSTNITDEVWHHVVMTRSLTGFKLYVDATLTSEYTGTLGSFTMYQFRGGGSPYYDDFEGYYDQHGFWTRQLNFREILFLNNNNNGRTFNNF